MVTWAEYSPPHSLSWLSEGVFMETGWLQLSSWCPQYTKLRLPISPGYLCSIWYEIGDECPSRRDAKKSGLQAVRQTIAPAWQKQCRTAASSSRSSTCGHGQRIPSLRQVTEVPRNPAWPYSSLAALRLAVLVWRESMMKKQSRRSLYPQGHFEKNSMFPLFFLQLRSQASLNESSCWLYS